MPRPGIAAALQRLVLLANLAVLLAIPGPTTALQAGSARRNITPAPVMAVPMSGYARGYEHPSTGLQDSLWARVVVLDDGSLRVAIVSVDLIGFNVDADPGPGRLAQQLRSRGIDSWLVVSTHTHGGPRTLDLGAPYVTDRDWGGDIPYTTWVEDRIIDGVAAAVSRLQPVQLRAGKGAVELSFNRRLVHPSGRVEMIWGRYDQFSQEQLGPTDPEVGVLCLDDLSGQPVAVLVNYACHAVVLGSGNSRITADFPGYAMAYLERQLPGTVALFLQGGAGDLDPRIDVQNSFAPARGQGETLGAEALRVVRSLARTQPLAQNPRLAVSDWHRSFRLNSDPAEQVTVGYRLLRVGRQLALAGLPGEPFVGLQLDLKARSPLPHTYLLGYTNGYVGYLPTLAAHHEGGYGADTGDTFQIQPEAGEMMIDDIIAELQQGLWELPMADTLHSGSGTELRAVLRPPADGANKLFADLSALGGPAHLPLMDMGTAGFSLAHRIGPDLTPGHWQVHIFVQTSGEPPRKYVTVPVVVLPGRDMRVIQETLEAGWTIAEQGRIAVAGTTTIDGVDAITCRAERYEVWQPSDFWALEFVSQAVIDMSLYDHLRFLFHPGDIVASEYRDVYLQLGGCRVDLSQWIDFDNRGWQFVDLDLGGLACDASGGAMRFWGWSEGDFYLAEMALTLDRTSVTLVTEGTPEPSTVVPVLAPNYPNPFNGETVISFLLSTGQQVELVIYDLLGRHVRTLSAGPMASGHHQQQWDGRDDAGHAVASGVYLCRLTAGGHAAVRRLVVVR